MSQINPNFQKNKEVVTSSLIIKGNIIECNNMIIQLSNVSTFEAVNAPSTPFPLWSLILPLIALLLLKSSLLLSIILFIIFGIVVYSWNNKNQTSKNHRYLYITLNSREIISIMFTDLEFLEKVLDCIKEILANPKSNKEYHINIKGNTINGGNIVKDMNL